MYRQSVDHSHITMIMNKVELARAPGLAARTISSIWFSILLNKAIIKKLEQYKLNA